MSYSSLIVSDSYDRSRNCSGVSSFSSSVLGTNQGLPDSFLHNVLHRFCRHFPSCFHGLRHDILHHVRGNF